jgi:hypothetical protein
MMPARAVTFVVLVVVTCLLLLGVGNRNSQVAKESVEPKLGSFRVECTLARQQQVDPIVDWGRRSRHMHDFFGNRMVVATSTFESLYAGTSSCSATADRGAYWAPTLMTVTGRRVRPEQAVVYYRNRPVTVGKTVAFPSGLRLVAGGTFPNAYWTCDGDSDGSLEARRPTIPDCGSGGKIKAHVIFPSCWDGTHLDAADHRSHFSYGIDDDGRISSTEARSCPRSHPVKLPELDLRILYDVSDGHGYRLSDGSVLPHADYFNAWVQRDLKQLISRCLGRVGTSCGLIED